MAETPNYGLTRIGADDALSKNGYAALDGDRITLDNLLHALEYHNHDASVRLEGPLSLPALSTTTTGGILPAATTYYYKVSLVDRWGLETAASSEVSITTPAAVSVGTAPALNVYDTAGSMSAGQYSYVYTFETSDGGETTASPASAIRITTGTTNWVKLTLPTFPATVVAANIYRSKPGQSQYYLIGDTITDEFDDTGIAENYTITPPTSNTTASTNSIAISLEAWTAGEFDGVAAWRIYRATSAGAYADRNLVHHVVETVSDTDSTLVKSWIDTGETLMQGIPRLISATTSGGAVIDLSSIEGSLPLDSIPRGARCLTFGGPLSGVVFDGSSGFPKIHLPYNVNPVSFSLSATGVSGRTSDHINVSLDSSTGGTSLAVHVDNDSGAYITTWPLVATHTIQAETADRSGNSVLALADASASSGMAVELNAMGEYIQESMTLEPGVWTPSIRCRFTGTAGSDLRLSAYLASAPTVEVAYVLFQAGTTASATTYSVVTPALSLTVATTASYIFRIKKEGASATAHIIDYFTILTSVPTLQAGELSISHPAPSGGSMGTYHQYTLWF